MRYNKNIYYEYTKEEISSFAKRYLTKIKRLTELRIKRWPDDEAAIKQLNLINKEIVKRNSNVKTK